jgi:SAM-dependent methyltransferase
LDWVYRAADKARSELVAALASDTVLDRFNDIAYASTRSYRPDTSSFRAYLFPWEEETIGRFFPQPPAHVLVGGAGGGREALALVELGYRVTAFEPSPELAQALATRAREVEGLTVFRARYEDLPRIEGISGRESSDLYALAPIDAVIAGWGSFSHLRTHELRVAALRSLAQTTHGPLLVSFLGLYDGRGEPESIVERLRRALPRRNGRAPGDVFSVYVGFFHRTNEWEIEALARAADLEIVHRSFDERDTNWPHVVLRRS